MATDQAVRSNTNDDSMSDAKMEDDVEVIASTTPADVPETKETKKEEEEDGDDDDVDAQLEKYKERLKIVEQQSKQLKSENGGAAEPANDKDDSTADAASGGVPMSMSSDAMGGVLGPDGTITSVTDNDQAIAAVDARSVYVGNVDYGATVKDLGEHFSDCGAINRVTIMCNKATGMPKGFAYIEFTESTSVKHATILDGTTFRERKLKVVAKRTNIPGLGYRGRGRPRYRGRRGGRGRRGFRGRGWGGGY